MNIASGLKKLLFCLVLLLLSAAFLSCADQSPGAKDPDGGGGAGDTGDGGEPGTAENPRFAVKEEIPELDYGGKTYTIVAPAWSMYNDYYFAERQIGDKINDVVYTRQKNVEERLNITIASILEPVTPADWNYAAKFINSARAGSDDYQMILTHCIINLTELCTGGYVQDWNKIPIVDLSKPWWNQRMNQTMAVDKILLTAVSDFIIFDPNVIYFNKQMAADLNIGDIYGLVREGKWTWKKVTELAKLASRDLNGDGLYDHNDQYGFVTNLQWMMNGAVQACDMYFTKPGDDGYPVNNLNNERFGGMLGDLYELICVGNHSFVGTWDPNQPLGGNESQVPMSSGRALFHVDPLSAGKRYRAYDVEFGILPFPKYDEAQKDYLSLSWNGFMMVPVTADPQLAGAVSEALSAESHRWVVPAYYDVLLTSKIARDEESTEMLDIIYKGAVYDFGLNFGNFDAITFAVDQLLTQKSMEYVSFMEKNENNFNKRMKSVYDKIRENHN